MATPREVLTPDALALVQAVADLGSFAAAARELGKVPSALTYRIRQVEDALDVLLFDRSSRQAKLTAAGNELICAGQQLLQDIDAMANRVKRVATGWESEFTIAVDSALSQSTVMELAEAFYAQAPTTRLRLREEVLAGTLDALVEGRADLALGVVMEPATTVGVHSRVLGEMRFIYAVAPHHPLASWPEPIRDDILVKHRGVAVADSTRGTALTFGLLSGQDVLTVPSMRAKLDAQLRGLGGGFVPEALVRPYLESGRLVAREVQRPTRSTRMSYAWRHVGNLGPGRALQWWLGNGWRAAPPAARCWRGTVTHDRVPRALRALAHRAVACRLAGGGAGQLAGRARPRRRLAGAHRRCRHAALRARRRRGDLAAARSLRPAPRRAAGLAIAPPAAVPAGAGPIGAGRPRLPLRLLAQGHRGSIARARAPRERHGELVYPGTCRDGLSGRVARAWRLRVEEGVVAWTDRRLGPQSQDVASVVGDFVLKRADGLFAYQLAVVVDDAAQGITHIVRGEDLADNTARQLLLQRALGHSSPGYLHTPLVLAADGQKLSKQNGAAPLELRDPLAVLQAAAGVLGLHVPAAASLDGWLALAVGAWSRTIGG